MVDDRDLSPTSAVNGIQDIQITGGVAYLAMGDSSYFQPNGEGGACRLSIPIAGNLQNLAFGCYATGPNVQAAEEIQLINGRFYAAFSGGLHILDANGHHLGELLFDFLPIKDAAQSGNLLYIADRANLTVYDPAASAPIVNQYPGDFRRVFITTINSQKYAVLQRGETGIVALNVNNPIRILPPAGSTSAARSSIWNWSGARFMRSWLRSRATRSWSASI